MNVFKAIRRAVVSISLDAYITAAIGVPIVGFFGIFLAEAAVHSKVRGQPHLREALEIVADHEYARNTLGPPIQIGNVDFRDRANNYVGKLDSKLRIPLYGKANSGYMNIEADRPSDGEAFKTKTIELELDEFSVVIYDRDS